MSLFAEGTKILKQIDKWIRIVEIDGVIYKEVFTEDIGGLDITRTKLSKEEIEEVLSDG